MNTEDFVTYEQAEMLKECGFDWGTEYYYDFENPTDTEVVFKRTSSCNPFNHNAFAESFSAPSLAQAAKWLREVKGIYIEVKVRDHNAFETVGKVIDNKTPHLPLPKYLFDLWDYRNPYTTYESALSAGIDAALELLITNR